jgi:membrane protein implicated in regulation of membrane protease activity
VRPALTTGRLQSGDDRVNDVRGVGERRRGLTPDYAAASQMIIIITLILALLFLPWPWSLAAIAAAAVFEVSLAVFGIGYSRRRRAQVGVQTMVGTLGQAITTLAPNGQVKIDGEIWEARAKAQGVRAGDTIRVKRVDGLTLEVEPAEAP